MGRLRLHLKAAIESAFLVHLGSIAEALKDLTPHGTHRTSERAGHLVEDRAQGDGPEQDRAQGDRAEGDRPEGDGPEGHGPEGHRGGERRQRETGTLKMQNVLKVVVGGEYSSEVNERPLFRSFS